MSSNANLQRILSTTSASRGALIIELMAAHDKVALLSVGLARKVCKFCPSLGFPIGFLSLKRESVGIGLPPLALQTAVMRSPAAILGEIFPSTSIERAGREVGPGLVLCLLKCTLLEQ